MKSAAAKASILRVALGQINATVGDLRRNTAKIREMSQKAAAAGASLILFPELAVTGYPPEDLLLKKSFVDENLRAMRQIARASKGPAMVAGFVDRDAGGLYNAAGLAANGRLIGVYRKMELPNYGVFDEKRYFKSGAGLMRFALGGIRFGVTICEDIWIDAGPGKHLCAGEGIDVLLNISSSPYHARKGNERERLIRKRARDYGVHVLYVNLVGGQDELVFDGQSLAVSPAGKVLARGKPFEEDLALVDLEIPRRKASARKTSAKKLSAIPARTYKVPVSPAETLPPLERRQSPALGETAEIFSALALGTRDYIRKNGFGKVVVGLSGGVDSALTAAIAKDALGADNVTGVLMPSPYSSQGSIDDALALAKNLGIRTLTLPIEPAMRAYEAILKESFRGAPPGLAEENLQARARGNLLMALSNKFGWLVLTTGNKSEIGVGYCTLYGDMAGGFAVLKDVPKTLVYKLARYLNERDGRDTIPRATLDKPPSAELRPDQKDSDSLPEYDRLDPILHEYVERDKSPREIYRRGMDPAEVQRVVRLVDQSEYKRRQSPPGVKITPKSFGKDRRLPITNRFDP